MRRTSSNTPSTSDGVDGDCPVKKERSGTILKSATTKNILKDLVKKRYLLNEDICYLECSDFELCTTEPYDTEDIKELALSIYYMNSEGYDYVRKTYKTVLPPPQDLGKLWMNDTYKPGFTSKAFELLKLKSAKKRPICALVVDDISLFEDSVWLEESYWIGIEDFGVGQIGEDDEEFARDAYVFTLVSLDENWKIPIAYVMVKNTSYKRRASLIITCLRESFYCGVDVVALNFELLNSFKAVAVQLGCDFSDPRDLKTTFKHPECDIAISVFFNTWWLKVMVRNTLECNILTKEKKKVAWQPIKNMKSLQERSVDYKKLTKEHLDFKNQLLKLDLTNLTFSYNVAEALMSYTEMIEGSDEEDAKATTEYVVVFNKLCDVLSSATHADAEFKKVLREDNSKQIFDFLDEAKHYILSLKLKKTPIVDTNKSECYVAFLICIESLKHLYKSVVERNQKLPYIATQKFSSDNTWALVENLLRKGNREPRAAEFKKIYEILGTNLRASPFATSCILAENLPMTKFAEAITNIHYTSGRLAYNQMYANIYEEAEVLKKHKKDKSLDTMKVYVKILNTDVTEGTNEIVGALAGWVVKELIKVVKCEKCLDALLTNEVKWFHKMIPIRVNVCGFCLPSEDVFKICSKAEILTNKFKRQVGDLMNNAVSLESLKVAVLERFVDSDLFSGLEGHSKEQTPMYNHILQLTRAVIDKYVDVRTDNIKISKPKTSSVRARRR